ncbi:MAG: hypothetical protein AB7G87_13205 [Clostridia bacterium]
MNNCVRAPKVLPPFFLTVSMLEKTEQKLEMPSAERNDPASFIFSVLSLKFFSPISFEKRATTIALRLLPNCRQADTPWNWSFLESITMR